MIRFILTLIFLTSLAHAQPLSSPVGKPLPIDDLWQSELFRKTVTGSFGIDSRIEPRITVDEEFYLDGAAKKMAAKDRKGAIKTLRDCSLLAASPTLLFALATFQFEQGELDMAVGNFEKALKKFPNFRDAHRNLAIVLVQQEKFKEAIAHLARAIELGSRESITMGLLAYCHAVSNHHRAALDAYRLAALTQPAQRQWRMGEAQALQALKQPREAASIFQQLIDQKPEQLALWLSQADNWIALQQPVDAITNLEFAYRADELTAEAMLSLGHLYLQNQMPDLAVQRYQAALRYSKQPSLTRVIESLELLASLGEWEKAAALAEQVSAAETFQKALAAEGLEREVSSRFHRQLALIKLETGDAIAGEKLVTAWLDKEPLDGLALILLARFKEMEYREEAEMLLERAEGLPEYAAAAHRAHGKLLVSAGDYAAALKHLKKSQQLKASETLKDYVRAVEELVDSN